jgi:hypothetical protein
MNEPRERRHLIAQTSRGRLEHARVWRPPLDRAYAQSPWHRVIPTDSRYARTRRRRSRARFAVATWLRRRSLTRASVGIRSTPCRRDGCVGSDSADNRAVTTAPFRGRSRRVTSPFQGIATICRCFESRWEEAREWCWVPARNLIGQEVAAFLWRGAGDRPAAGLGLPVGDTVAKAPRASASRRGMTTRRCFLSRWGHNGTPTEASGTGRIAPCGVCRSR